MLARPMDRPHTTLERGVASGFVDSEKPIHLDVRFAESPRESPLNPG